ncbi:hypothetical protein LTR02_014826 [Friedmanniomyces endolithicus]|nr:hypothetical protein LTR94_015758 [Friedmanniomyces endolithicus]KAK0771365.1 hypothetical protein LTR59_016140 [Friedmanniomyces endolithicus]KAK0777324.1 hypothetical protein LTR38_015202 [Friedmanniomyces endolithicus]KAK0781339.1 hypothetical protein LTR75_014741 [Friedmanniomyces endolithicus]KAK0836539.1 hypothetical protein LTR03_013595 [Friedmanniomyces endolithicus]
MAPTAFQYIQIAFTLALAFLCGLSACFTLWVIPLLQLPRVPAQAKAAELTHLVTLGGKYLQPGSRMLGAASVGFTAWSYAVGNDLWGYYLLCFALLVPIAVWEIYMIFPINDRIADIDQQMMKGGSEALKAEQERELGRLLDRWTKMHTVRFVLPGLAAIASASAMSR